MRNKQFISYLVVTLVLSALFVTNLALAVTIPAGAGQATGAFGVSSGKFSEIVKAVVDLALGLAGLIAITFVIYGGFRYMTAGGNEDAAEAGKKILFNAIIGLVIIIMGYVILVVVQNAVAGGQV